MLITLHLRDKAGNLRRGFCTATNTKHTDVLLGYTHQGCGRSFPVTLRNRIQSPQDRAEAVNEGVCVVRISDRGAAMLHLNQGHEMTDVIVHLKVRSLLATKYFLEFKNFIACSILDRPPMPRLENMLR